PVARGRWSIQSALHRSVAGLPEHAGHHHAYHALSAVLRSIPVVAVLRHHLYGAQLRIRFLRHGKVQGSGWDKLTKLMDARGVLHHCCTPMDAHVLRLVGMREEELDNGILPELCRPATR